MACSSCCERRRIFLRDDQIDLVRELGHRLVEADQVFRRRQSAQRVAHFGEPVLDAGQRAAVDAGLAAFGDALGQALDLLLDGVDGVARHRIGERAADLAEFGAQGIDRFLDARLAQRLDLIGDLAKLILQSRQILCRHRRNRPASVAQSRPAAIAALRPVARLAVERALAGGDFGNGAIERRRHAASSAWPAAHRHAIGARC